MKVVKRIGYNKSNGAKYIIVPALCDLMPGEYVELKRVFEPEEENDK